MLQAFVVIAFSRVDVGIERCYVTPPGTLREKVQWMEGSIWTACSGVALRSVQDPVVPQQGHMPRLQSAKGHETGRVHQRVVTVCGLAAAGWRPAQALAMVRQQLAQARAAAMPETCFRILENEVQQQKTAMKQAQPMEQKMDQAQAQCRRAVESGEMQAEGPGELRACAAGGDASPDRPGPARAGSPAASDASSTSQCEPGQNLGSFDGDHRKLVEPRRSSTTRAPDTRKTGVEANPPDPFGFHVSGRWRSFGRRIRRRTGSRALGSGR